MQFTVIFRFHEQLIGKHKFILVQYERFSNFYAQNLGLRDKLGMCLAKASHRNGENYVRKSL